MDELTKKDCDQLLEEIQHKRELAKEKRYSSAVINKMRYLIRIVFDAAVEMGVLTENCLWGSPDYAVHGMPNSIEEINQKELVILKKSLTPQEERKAFRMLMSDPTQDGYRMAMALMLSLGVRNAEACGAKFGNMISMASYPGCYALYIATTTVGNTSNLKTGGKTNNAPRKLPVPDMLAQLILQRRSFLEKKILAGEIVLDDGQQSVDDLPIACRTTRKRQEHTNEFINVDDYTTHLRSGDLTRFGKGVLATIGVNEVEVACIEKQMDIADDSADVELKEKDPTVYLFRRNLGTHLSLLGLSQTETEAVMGHSILDSEVEKNDLENDDYVYRIKQKMDERPLFNPDPPSRKTLGLGGASGFSVDSVADCTMKIELEKGKEAHLQITANEPNQELTITIKNGDQIPFKYWKAYIAKEAKGDVSVVQLYQRMYEDLGNNQV